MRVAIWSWNVRHAAEMADRHRQWYRLNREQALENSRAWSQANRSRKNLYQRARQKQLSVRGWTADEFDKAQPSTVPADIAAPLTT